MKDIIYEGFFIKNLGGTLKNVIEAQHITTQFKPIQTHTELYGEKAKFKIVGYAIDENNEGYKVEFISGSEKLRALYELAPVPHITLSISSEGKAKDTVKLSFYEIDGFEVESVFGGFDGVSIRTTF